MNLAIPIRSLIQCDCLLYGILRAIHHSFLHATCNHKSQVKNNIFILIKDLANRFRLCSAHITGLFRHDVVQTDSSPLWLESIWSSDKNYLHVSAYENEDWQEIINKNLNTVNATAV